MKLEDEEFLEDGLEELGAEKASSKGMLIMLLGAFLVVVLLVVVIFFMTGDRDETSSAYDKKVTAEQGPTTETTEPIPSQEMSPSEEPSTETELSTSEESSVETELSTSEEPSAETELSTSDVSATEPEETIGDESMNFYEVEEEVTAKEATNLRDIPSQGEDSTVLNVLQNGEVAQRIAISDAGWSKLLYNGEEYYAVSSLLTTDLDYHVEVEIDDGIKTVFTPCNDRVSPKIEVNLRKLPSVTHEEASVVVTLPYGEVVTRTGVNTDLGWSRVEYNGEVLYCISSYVYVVE